MSRLFPCTRRPRSRHDNGMRTLAAQLVRHFPTSSDLRTDGDLLNGFLTHGSEDDFAELVRRHGPLVWGVCRRALPDPADAEDAFQATFLVLVRRGGKLASYPTIGPWMHKVAAWTARNVRRRNARRLAKQSALPDHLPAPNTDTDLPLDIDVALLSLPEKFRSPIVLCHLLGYSRADAAERLGCAEGTLSSWLARGLAKLRANFGGLDPTKTLGVALVTVPTVLTSSVVRAAVASRVAVAATAAVSSTVSQVVEGVMRMFWIKKATAASMAACVVFALGVGVGMSGRLVEGVAGGQDKSSATSEPTGFTDRDKEIAELEAQMDAAHLRLLKALDEVVLSRDKDVRDRYQKQADDAYSQVKALRDRASKVSRIAIGK
jgi:RNA polymerase sigma factor (sigma-70 family)